MLLYRRLSEHSILLTEKDGKIPRDGPLAVAAPHPRNVQELVARIVLVDAQQQVRPSPTTPDWNLG